MIQAIETHYKGYRFRSRLEARWAVFFDAMGIPWEYETEGYELPSGRYLPDFFLPMRESEFPNAGSWVEVKGQEPTDEEKDLLTELCQATKHTSYLVEGLPGKKPIWHVHHSMDYGEYLTLPGPVSGFTDSRFGLGCLLTRYSQYWDANQGWDQAIEKAISARFEHGERP